MVKDKSLKSIHSKLAIASSAVGKLSSNEKVSQNQARALGKNGGSFKVNN